MENLVIEDPPSQLNGKFHYFFKPLLSDNFVRFGTKVDKCIICFLIKVRIGSELRTKIWNLVLSELGLHFEVEEESSKHSTLELCRPS